MKKLTNIFVISVLFLGTCLFFSTASAASKAQEYLGEPQMCVDTYRIKETRIINNQSILFIMRGGERYINYLPVKCTGLVLADGFSYETSISKLCKQDSIKTLSPGSAPGTTCLLGDFIPFKADMKDGEAVKLLKEGLLEELVSEGAFVKLFKNE
jgi:hypothetical protein